MNANAEILSQILDPQNLTSDLIIKAKWSELLPAVQLHMLGSRFYRLLKQERLLEIIPPTVQKNLYLCTLRAHQLHLLYESFAEKIRDVMKAQGIPVYFLKGIILAKRFYEVPEDRIFYDLDLLFLPHDRRRVEKYFEENGYKRIHEKGRWHANNWKTEYVSLENPDIIVECHFGLGYGKYLIKDFYVESKALTLDPEIEYLYLLYHAGVQHRFQKLVWLLDLIQIQEKHPSISERVRKRAKALHLLPALNFSELLIKKKSSWFERIALGSVESSFYRKASMRAAMQGGWTALAGYAFYHFKANAFGKEEPHPEHSPRLKGL